MGRRRAFDWDEAKRLRGEGWTIAEVAERMGVSKFSVLCATNDKYRTSARERTARIVMSGECVDCGRTCSRYHPRCKPCSARAQATSVRDGELHCSTCDSWKPDDAFPFSRAGRAARRGRHGMCRACNTKAKRAYRERNRKPCSHGCGRLVDAVNRRNNSKPLECRSCAQKRVVAEKRSPLTASRPPVGDAPSPSQEKDKSPAC